MPMTIKPVRFEQDTLDKLDKLAALHDRDASYMIRQAVDDMISAHEWQVAQSMETLRKVQSGEMKTYTHEEVTQRLKEKGILK